MAAVAGLRPTNAYEARLAVDVVAADAHAKECLRLAAHYFNDFTAGLRCRAQFAVMMRRMHSALRTLDRVQAARQKAAAEPALGETQHAAPAPARPADSQATRDPALPGPAPQPDPLAAAEDCAVMNPLFAARIRVAGGLPAPLDFTPPDPAIVETLVNGTSPLLSTLDEIGRDLAPVA